MNNYGFFDIVFETIDLFSGAGGVTTGIEQAEVNGLKVATVICAINHDEIAILSHSKNHPNVKHFVEDIRTFNVKNLPKVKTNDYSKRVLWASLECTNHSNAKGGLSRDADSRTLAEHLPPYVIEFGPAYICIENVKEFAEWGPLKQKIDAEGNLIFSKKGKPHMVPDPDKKGIDFTGWVNSICKLGYRFEMKMLNAADFGAHTSRKRLFIIFAKEGFPILWPEPTHDKNKKNGLPGWKPVKECLDFSDKGENIFGRKKNLCENTYKRIYAGLKKFIAHGDDSFITKYLGNNEHTGSNNGKSINEPCLTVTTQNRLGLVQTEFLLNYHHSSDVNSIEMPSPTLTTHDKLALITTDHFVAKYNSSHNNTKQNSGNSIDEPCSTITVRSGLGLISVDHFIDMQHGAGQQNQSIEHPSGSLLTIPKKQLVTVERFIDQQFGNSKPISINEPCNSLTANPKYNVVSAFLMNRQYNNVGSSIDKPCFTLIANMNKRPGYLIQVETGELAIKVEESDTEYMRKIKMFMAAYGIIAIYMRMLRIPELKKITGLPYNYILLGTQADQKKFIGNAVPPVLPKNIFQSLYIANNIPLKVAV